MNPALRQEYLAALGLQTWVARSTPRDDAGAAGAPRSRRGAGPRWPARLAGAREAGVDWPELRARVAACTRCTLCTTRTQTVFGVGSQTAEWLIVGEAPGAEEDRQGEPFVGRAGPVAEFHAARDRIGARAGVHR